MTPTETGLYVGFATLVVQQIFAYVKAQSWVTRLVESLVADLRNKVEELSLKAEQAIERENECQKRLSRLEHILVDITDDTSPAE